jgi:hypothetical protein
MDAIVARYASNGSLLWVKVCGGTGESKATGLAISADASVQVLGNYTGNCDLDPSDNLQSTNAQGSTDIFRLHVSQEGDFQEAWSYGGFNADYEGGVVCDATSNAYVVGGYTEQIDLDASIASGVVYAEGTIDAFVVKYGSCPRPGLNNPTDWFSTVGSDVSFSYGSSDAAFDWQWQILVGNTYINLQDDGTYFGTNGPDLLIANAPLLLDLSRYRCVVVANGCEFASYSAQLHLNCAFSIIGQSSDVTVNAGENANFGVFSDVLDANIQWQILQGGIFVDLVESAHYTGVNSATLTINNVVFSENNSLYRCKLEYLGCVYYSDSRELNVLNTAGIWESEKNNLHLYPNPVESGIITIANAPLGVVYSIFNSTGSLVLQGNLYQPSQVVDVASLSSGLYIVRAGEQSCSFLVK